MWMIMQKELTELLRDKKTLFFMIALPLLLFPAIFGAVGFFSSKAITEAENKTLNFAVIGAEHHQVLVDALAAVDTLELKTIGDEDFKTLIKDKTLDFVVELQPNANGKLLEVGQTTVNLYLNDAGLNQIQKRFNKVLDGITEGKRADAFAELGISETQQIALLEPVIVEKINIAEERENWGERIGGLVPYLLFLLCLQGAMFPASDLGAGEKERGTLETLLLAPVDRTQLVLGKFATIALAGIVAAMVTVFSMALWSIIIGNAMAISFVIEIVGQISIIDFVLMFLMLVPVASIFAAVLLSLSIYAKSYKEAQSYMGSLVIFVIVPIMIALMPGVELEGVWAWVPLTNVALAMKELVKGTMDYVQLIAIFSSTVVIAGALLAFCVYWFKQEKVLFR
ncbi:MAG: ABC transporter permease subunit [Alteromonadaceae bacterium]|nr:ABC transporter permease subunit [Alteromonadaceae bacterium]